MIKTKIFLKTKKYWYCAYNNGIITRTPVKSLDEFVVNQFTIKTKGNELFCSIEGKHYMVKKIIADAFLEGTGEAIIHINGKINDNREKNLMYTSKKNCKVNKRVILQDDNGIKEYESQRQCALDLFLSEATISYYVRNKVINKSIQGIKRKAYDDV